MEKKETAKKATTKKAASPADLKKQNAELVKERNGLIKERDDFKERWEVAKKDVEKLEVFANAGKENQQLRATVEEQKISIHRLEKYGSEMKTRFEEKVLELEEHKGLNKRLAEENANLLSRQPSSKPAADVSTITEFPEVEISNVGAIVEGTVKNLKAASEEQRRQAIELMTKTLNGLGVKSFDRSGARLGI